MKIQQSRHYNPLFVTFLKHTLLILKLRIEEGGNFTTKTACNTNRSKVYPTKNWVEKIQIGGNYGASTTNSYFSDFECKSQVKT